MKTHIIGWAHSPFGRLAQDSLEALIALVAEPAIRNSGLEASDIDAVFIGVFNNGFQKQDFPSSLVLQAVPSLRFKGATRLENACATGSAAVYAAMNYIEAGRGRTALVIGAEKMTALTNQQVGEVLLGASYRADREGSGSSGFAGVFAQMAEAYFELYGNASDSLARIAAKNHRNGTANPFAQIRKDFGYEFCRTVSDSNPYVAQPLRRTDCSPISDGAAAIVLSDAHLAAEARRAIRFRAAEHLNDFLPLSRRDPTKLEGCQFAWQRALAASKLALDDLDFVETHDCFTIAELLEYEAMGLTPMGRGRQAIEEGWVEKGGKLPVNLSGGLKAKGHPIGATGVSMHALAAMQLAGEAGDMQLPGASFAGVFNMGGAGVANYVSILERSH
ncbi:thiolase domain-containing protein [Caenimonas koreensis DSM 17982]|uniref:Thiolase domain-containing protein n=1 Tax=Caenimonas koreensis DSM 17982 TaxID=1121255 RepID=A0A844AYW6_9BURK|nr:acetyl-CoA acetyltransferase [Caenimonas koreensis]MRD49750.1 thiolase domain-containing protein [Caenimonas koreensis DSM 17982]